jgi:hypothetical protein
MDVLFSAVERDANRRGAKGVIECEGGLCNKPGCGGRDFSALLFPYKRASPRRAKRGVSNCCNTEKKWLVAQLGKYD